MMGFYIDKRARLPTKLCLIGLFLGAVGFMFVFSDADRSGGGFLSLVGTIVGVLGIATFLIGLVVAFIRMGPQEANKD